MLPLAFSAFLAANAPDTLAAPMVAAERAFADDARLHGTRRAFLAHFDSDSWLFRPHPTPALQALARDPDDGAPLQWEPEIAGIAASGDMGFTSGPWSARSAGVETSAHGHFLTVWKRGEDGVWRVEVDGGISHAPLDAPVRSVTTLCASAATEVPALSAPEIEQRRQTLEHDDDTLRRALGDAGGRSAWSRFADPEWRVLRRDHPPATGEAATTLAYGDPPQRGSGPRRALDLARSGDLAYTLGGNASCMECGNDFRVWRWTPEGWRVWVDLETP